MIAVEENTTLVGLTELRSKLKEVLAALKNSKVVLALRNRPLAVLVPFERYRRMEALLDRIEDRALGYVALERAKTPDAEFIDLDVVERRLKLR